MNRPVPTHPWHDGEWTSRDSDKGSETASLPIVRSVISAAIDTGELDLALEIGGRHVDAGYKEAHGAEVVALEREAELVGARKDIEQASLNTIDARLSMEPPQIPAPLENGGTDGPGDPDREIPPNRWQLRDKVGAGLITLTVLALIIASFFGFHATFAAAQLPIFDDFPHLPFLLAVLAPAAGLAIKFAATVFDDPANRKRYRQVLAFGGIASFLIYVPMLSALFEGLSGVWDPFAEPNHLLGWGFNVTHIVAEALITAALYDQLTAIMNKYAPSTLIDNPARPPLERQKADLLEAIEALVKRLGRIEGRLAQLDGVRDSAQVLVEAAIRQRMNEQPREGLL